MLSNSPLLQSVRIVDCQFRGGGQVAVLLAWGIREWQRDELLTSLDILHGPNLRRIFLRRCVRLREVRFWDLSDQVLERDLVLLRKEIAERRREVEARAGKWVNEWREGKVDQGDANHMDEGMEDEHDLYNGLSDEAMRQAEEKAMRQGKG